MRHTSPLAIAFVLAACDPWHVPKEYEYTPPEVADNQTVVAAGVDSLTAGGGWQTYFIERTRGGLGDGGPGYSALTHGASGSAGASFGRGGGFGQFDQTSPLAVHSLTGTGGVGTGTGGYFNWLPASAWDKARILYLKQPGGGSLNCGPNDGARPVTETASPDFELGVIEVRSVPTSPGGRVLTCDQINGHVVVFGVSFMRDEGGLLMHNLGTPGLKLEHVGSMASAMRRSWFAELAPDHYLLNGGMNDRWDSSPPEHGDHLRAVIADLRAVRPAARVYIVQSNESSDAATSNLLAFFAVKKAVAAETGSELVDVRDVMGTYGVASARGLMADQVHPNDAGNRLIGLLLAERTGL